MVSPPAALDHSHGVCHALLAASGFHASRADHRLPDGAGRPFASSCSLPLWKARRASELLESSRILAVETTIGSGEAVEVSHVPLGEADAGEVEVLVLATR